MLEKPFYCINRVICYLLNKNYQKIFFWNHKALFFQLAIDFLELLQPSPRLQHGMAVMIWSTVIRDNFQKLYALMNEQGVTGVALKERVLKRDVHVVESDLVRKFF